MTLSDDGIVLALNNAVFGHSTLMDKILVWFPMSGAATLPLVGVVWYLLVREKDPERWSRLIAGLFAAVVAAGVSLALQHSFLPFSPRPFMVLSLPTGEALRGLRQHSGMPSDYSGFVVAIATCIAFNNRRLGVIMFIWALALCLLRIAEGAHFVGQTAAGCMLGFLIAAGARRIPLPQSANKLRAQPFAWVLTFVVAHECASVFADAQSFVSMLH